MFNVNKMSSPFINGVKNGEISVNSVFKRLLNVGRQGFSILDTEADAATNQKDTFCKIKKTYPNLHKGTDN